MKIILRILSTALALLLCTQFVPGITVPSFLVALIAAVVLGLLNLIVRPVLFILTLPITLLSLGLFSFVINAVLFLLTASFVSEFAVDGFIPALIGSLIVSVVNAISSRFIS